MTGRGLHLPLISWQPYRDTIEYIGGKDWSAVKHQFADRWWGSGEGSQSNIRVAIVSMDI